MIEPENNIEPDDTEYNEADDQQSQQDIHSNGLDEEPTTDNEANTDLLTQADAASSPSYTLNFEDDIIPEQDEKKQD